VNSEHEIDDAIDAKSKVLIMDHSFSPLHFHEGGLCATHLFFKMKETGRAKRKCVKNVYMGDDAFCDERVGKVKKKKGVKSVVIADAKIRRKDVEWDEPLPVTLAEVAAELEALVPRIERKFNDNAMSEPFYTGEWNKIPYTRRPYEEIFDYVAAPGMTDEVLEMLNTTKAATCNADDTCKEKVPYSIEKGCFLTDMLCKRVNIGCSASSIARGEGLTLGKELEIADMWGLDCFSRQNIQSVLEIAGGMMEEETQRVYIQRLLVPVIDFQPSDRSYDITHSLRSILHCLDAWEQTDTDEVKQLVMTLLSNIHIPRDSLLRCTRALMYFSLRFDLENFRIIPKGAGVRCIKPSGIPAGTFVTRYLGELYSPWRWFEKQDAIKNAQKNLAFKPSLPDFYNIMVERHLDDTEGYDVAFIDPIAKGNFASRLSHSCEPNCANLVMVVNGKYVVSLHTLRDIQYGEELAFDYSSVTEDKNEFLAASCLCYSLKCRGSFVGWAGAGAFEDVAKQWQTFLDRNALLFNATQQPLTQVDHDRLHKYGMKEKLLHGLPSWLVKWTSLVLQYVEFESNELPGKLIVKINPKTKLPLYDDVSAEIESRGVFENRKQNVAISINKIRRFLLAGLKSPMRLDQISSPFVVLSETQIVSKLCGDSEMSVLSRMVAQIIKRPEAASFHGFLEDILVVGRNVASMIEAKQVLKDLRKIVWLIPLESCTAAGDLLTWYIHTDHFFTSVSLSGGTSPEIKIRNIDIGKDGSVADIIKPAVKSVIKETREFKVRVAVSQGPKIEHILWNGSKSIMQTNYTLQPPVKPAPAWYKEVYNGMVLLRGISESDLLPLGDIDGIPSMWAFKTFHPSLVPFYIFPDGTIGTKGKSSDCCFYAFTEPRPGTVWLRVNAQAPCYIYCFPGATKFKRESAAKQIDPMKVVFKEKKKYQSGFVWGQLSGWFKQTVASPDASLSAERRGTLSLPDVESCFASGEYNDRQSLLEKIHDQPHVMWPTGTNWRFRNSLRMYGSPWFDEAVDPSLSVNRYEAIADMQFHMSTGRAPDDKAALQKISKRKKSNRAACWRKCTRSCCV